MKSEIDGLRLRLSQAELKAADCDRRVETAEAKFAAFEKEYTDIAAIKAEFNLRDGSLRDELDRLRRTNYELSNKIAASAESRRRIVANLQSLQATLGTSIRLVEDMSTEAYPILSGTTAYNASEMTADGRVIAASSAVVHHTRPARGTVPTAYIDHPVEAVADDEEVAVEHATTPAFDDQHISTETPGLLQGLFGSSK
jgi:hypothetical protein